MDVRDIVCEWLKQHSFDGLCDDECCCTIDDLMPCGDGFDSCEVGKKVPCERGLDCDGECGGWHIVPVKDAT